MRRAIQYVSDGHHNEGDRQTEQTRSQLQVPERITYRQPEAVASGTEVVCGVLAELGYVLRNLAQRIAFRIGLAGAMIAEPRCPVAGAILPARRRWAAD